MRLRNVKEEEINFSGGINAWNFQAAKGTADASNYTKSHQMVAREAPDGFCDDIVNMDFQADGSLIQRGYLLPRQFGATNGPNNAVLESAHMLTRQAYWDGAKSTYLLGIRDNTASVGNWKFYTDNHVSSPGWTVAGKYIEYTALFYNFNWYVFSRSNATGVNNLEMYFSGTTVVQFAVVFAYPSQAGLLEVSVWKDRGWGISDNNRAMCYSKATDMKTWSAAGGGGYFELPNKAVIKDYIIFNDQMYIIDSNNSIWVFVYYTDPGVDGSLRQIVDGLMLPRGVGSSSTYPYRKLATSDNKLFVAGGENIFQLVNDQLYPIANQLHLELNAYEEVRIYDLGYGILLHTYYLSGGNYNPLYWVYHHNTKAWTRYTFNVGSTGDENKKIIKEAHLINKPYESKFVMTLQGGLFTGQTNAFDPPAELRSVGFLGASPVDGYVDVWDGSGQQSSTYKFRVVKIKLKTRWLYLGMKQQYKLFREFILTAWFGYRQVGTGSNASPLKTTVEHIPGSTAPAKTTSDIQVLSDVLGAEYPYRVPVQQRARAVQLTFEWEDNDFWTSFQGFPSATDNILSSAYIAGLSVLYVPKDSHRRKLDGTAANSDSMSI